MPDKPWKAWERRVAKLFGGRRRGPDTTDLDGGGKCDVVETQALKEPPPAWAPEAKLLSRPSFGDLLEAARQAETNAPDLACPVAVVRKKGRGRHGTEADAVVVFRLETFREWFL